MVKFQKLLLIIVLSFSALQAKGLREIAQFLFYTIKRWVTLVLLL
jgi:hypothetical protein